MWLRRIVGLALGLGGGSLVIARAMRLRRAIDFFGKTVVIFGGSRGIGLEMARQIAPRCLVQPRADNARLDNASTA